jgi:translocation and assembly module TamB
LNDNKPKSRWRWFRRLLIWPLLGFVVLVLALVIYVHTDSFQARVHGRLISALEQMTGGRVELGKFSVVPFRFRVEVHDLTIHGTEGPGEIPYAHVDHLVAYIKIISIFESQYGFSSLSFDRPVIHVIVYPNGTTNQPSPRIRDAATKTPVEQLFAVSIGRLQITGGELIWNNSRVPLALNANQVSAELSYGFLRKRYEGSLNVGKLETRFRDFQPFDSGIAGQFSLAQNLVEVKSLRWISGRSHLEASGRVDDFRDPKFTGTYNGRIDLAEFGPLMGVKELRAGMLEIGGSGSYSAADYSATGQVFARDLEWRDKLVVVRNATLGGRYALTPTRLRISELQAKILGGTATGTADVSNWANFSTSSRGKKEQQAGSINLKFKDLSVNAVSVAFSSRKMPLDRMKLSGAASGSVDAKWRGRSQDADAAFSFEVNPAAQTYPGQIPVTGHGSGTYVGRGEELQIADLTLATRATQFHASGRLAKSATLRITANTTSLAEWQPMLNSFGGPQIPVALRGRAIFNGTANGKLSNFTIAGHVQMNDFETLLAGVSGRPAQQVRWDYLAADIQASPRMVSARNGTLTRGSSTIQFESSATLVNGTLTEFSPFTLRVHVRNGDVALLEAIGGYDYPVSGRMDLTLYASGTRLTPHGEGQVQLTDAVVYGQRIPQFTSDLRFSGGEAQFNNFVLAYRDSRITGAAAYNPGNRGFHFNATGSDFDLSHFAELQKARIVVEGRMNFNAQGGGTLDEPVINANVRLHDLLLDHERAGDFTFDAVTRGPDLQLTGRSNFEKAELAIDGSIRLRENWPADLTLRFDHLDVDSLLRTYLQDRVTGHSSVAGVLRVQGPLREPRLLSATGDLSYVSATVENVSVQNEGPVRFSVKNQVLSLDQLRLLGEGTDVTAVGTVHLTGDRELDVRADGNINMKLFESFSPDLTASGAVKVGVKVSGTYSFPSLLGRVDVTNGTIASNNLPNGLSDMNGVLLFNQDRLQIQTLTAHVGGGTVNLSGYMAYTPHLSFSISAHGSDVRLRPAGISATADADLKLTGTASDALLSGDITVVKLALSPGFDFARYLEASKQTTTLPQANTLLNKIRLDVHVTTTPELQMQSTLAKLSGDADLRLRGNIVRPVVLGRVDIMEGNIYFSGTKYRLERGEITFTGPVGIKPTLDLEATTHVRDYDITLGVNGTPEKLGFTYRSEPPLPEPDIIALLALGRTQSESATLAGGSSQSAFSQEASNVILNQALNATLNNRAQRLFGISRIKIDPQGLNTETSPTRSAPAVTIEQQVSNSLTLTYTTEVSQTSQQIIQAEYNVSHNVSILAVRDQNGVVSFDVRLRQRRK